MKFFWLDPDFVAVFGEHSPGDWRNVSERMAMMQSQASKQTKVIFVFVAIMVAVKLLMALFRQR